MSKSERGHGKRGDECCHIEIRIKSRGDVNIYNCTKPDTGSAPPSPSPDEDQCPPRAEGACIPLGLGCKPKQSRRRKLEKLASRKVPSAIGAAFFQTARRFLRGRTPANDFEQAAFSRFEAMSPELRSILRCAVDSFESTPSELHNAGLNPSLTADPEAPVDRSTLGAAILEEIK